MRILNLCYDDYANFSYENCQALKSVGIECESIKSISHPFNYPNASQIIQNKNYIHKKIDEADVVQLMHSSPEFLPYCVSKNKRIFVYHTGTNYRLNSSHNNSLFNPHVELSFSDQCEFVHLGAKNFVYIATAVNTDIIRHKLRPVSKDPYTIAHYPSNSSVKGTDKINEMLKRVPFLFKYNSSTLKASYAEQLERMSDCDIYIELFKPLQNGRPYGCFGVTAFEASAMGKIVITNNFNQDVYEKHYGFCPFQICNTEEKFIETIDALLRYPVSTIKKIQTLNREWIMKNHSYIATGNYITQYL